MRRKTKRIFLEEISVRSTLSGIHLEYLWKNIRNNIRKDGAAISGAERSRENIRESSGMQVYADRFRKFSAFIWN
jgi:hypothetical protein